jgi:hypothetical protein
MADRGSLLDQRMYEQKRMEQSVETCLRRAMRDTSGSENERPRADMREIAEEASLDSALFE